jgi:glucokinase
MARLKHAIGIDIGGGSTKIGLVSSDGAIIDRDRVTYDDLESADAIIGRVAGACLAMLARNAEIDPVGAGIGFPGPIHPGNMSGMLGNVPALNDMPLAARMAALISRPTRMENDASAAGIAEARFGGHKAARRQLLVTVGTGIGVAFTVDGLPFVTSDGSLGNAGHLIVNAVEPKRCRLGCLGCLESVASGEALDARAGEQAAMDPSGTIARSAAMRGQAVGTPDIVACALAGDPHAVRMLEDTGRWLGRASASWAHIFAPDLILVGGGVSAAGALLLGPIEREARQCGLEMYLKDTRFGLASLGNDAGIIGAASQFLQNT